MVGWVSACVLVKLSMLLLFLMQWCSVVVLLLNCMIFFDEWSGLVICRHWCVWLYLFAQEFLQIVYLLIRWRSGFVWVPMDASWHIYSCVVEWWCCCVSYLYKSWCLSLTWCVVIFLVHIFDLLIHSYYIGRELIIYWCLCKCHIRCSDHVMVW